MKHAPRFEQLCENARAHVKEVSVDEVAKRLEDRTAGKDRFELVDVREESEVAAGRIRGATAIGRGVLERDVEKVIPDPATEIILYCGGGFRSALSAESLAKMGYTKVRSMAGGWRAWKERGLPTE